MDIQERLLDVDDLWELGRDPAYSDRYIELIDGELIEMPQPGRRHGLLAADIVFYLRLYTRTREIGEITIESGYFSADDRHTLLGPDVAFLRYDRLPQPPTDKWVSVMPDLAVEIRSPGDSLAKIRRKAQIYLRNGTTIVWIVLPAQQGVEVWRQVEGSPPASEFFGVGDKLEGEDVLPGFKLDISLLFPPDRD